MFLLLFCVSLIVGIALNCEYIAFVFFIDSKGCNVSVNLSGEVSTVFAKKQIIVVEYQPIFLLVVNSCGNNYLRTKIKVQVWKSLPFISTVVPLCSMAPFFLIAKYFLPYIVFHFFKSRYVYINIFLFIHAFIYLFIHLNIYIYVLSDCKSIYVNISFHSYI